MNDQLSLENYSPFEVEKKWQEKWESLKAFSPNPDDDGEPFCVVIPPPNVTGSLHMGHAFNTALIDVVVRFQRLLVLTLRMMGSLFVLLYPHQM